MSESTDAVRSGMAAEVEFRFSTGQQGERIYVPSVAVGEDRDGRFVYVIEPTEDPFGIIHRKDVMVGTLAENGLEILSGLTEGDHLVTAGVSRIRDGQKVRLLPLSE